MIIVDYSAISSGFTDVVTALLLFLTLPVTVATAERSFSKLKLIKNYLRNTMGQERLSGLSLLAIEASRAKTMQTGKLIKRFSDMKARKMKLKWDWDWELWEYCEGPFCASYSYSREADLAGFSPVFDAHKISLHSFINTWDVLMYNTVRNVKFSFASILDWYFP